MSSSPTKLSRSGRDRQGMLKPSRGKYSKERWLESGQLWLMALLPVALILIFSYVPMYGIAIAFQDYVPGIPLLFDERISWVGFQWFERFINSIYFTRLLRNTLFLNFLNLLFGFWTPILFALLLNEVYATRFKRTVQTASYMPYFLSNVVVVGMVLSFLQVDGIINNIVEFFGGDRQVWITKPDKFPLIYTIINIWKSFGFNSILYMSTISSIDPALYEAARIDGARRFQMMRYITIPGIMPTIAITLILQVGSLLGSNADLILLLYTSATYSTADVFGTYIYRLGILDGQFSYTTAIGLMLTVVNFGLVFIANKISDRLTGFALW